MKFLVLLALVAVACATDDVSAPILKSSYDLSPEGSFQYVYETGNNIAAHAEGVVKNPNSDTPTLEVKGAFSYKALDGTPVDITYVANENGYQPQGSHLPVPPPIPAAIQRSLEYIAAHPPPPTSVKAG